jgi:hypothetical protein
MCQQVVNLGQYSQNFAESPIDLWCAGARNMLVTNASPVQLGP